eukprot:TRINITY_DN1310_c0_g1_i1.p1 TRINITY_DN1310_c0_g1~~TRINITY_DN1310_c0_g1_i1.p1  ORF type:complete len:278 (-),score=65.26 TRINITY_DN1310_c0_g1_i1:259-1092(-)
MSGDATKFTIHEFFMGAILHPRLWNGVVDVKMWAETRLSWNWLLLMTIGGAIQSAKMHGGVPSYGALFMVYAHWLYTNACAKGEHFIPYTWDIFREKFGWMLCFWNFCGVPMLYVHQSLYLASHEDIVLPFDMNPELYYGILLIIISVAYWIWDEAQGQKNELKAIMRGSRIERRLFPTFRLLNKPKLLKCDAGIILADGWYLYARKPHYTADTVMALCWGLSCGIGSWSPYFYVLFFGGMIYHRTLRDEDRMSKKYGETWVEYCKLSPYRYFWGLF